MNLIHRTDLKVCVRRTRLIFKVRAKVSSKASSKHLQSISKGGNWDQKASSMVGESLGDDPSDSVDTQQPWTGREKQSDSFGVPGVMGASEIGRVFFEGW